ncbi:MAG TPA: hypothetical protein VGJ54_20340 [Streptosporangiaceae bacterium]
MTGNVAQVFVTDQQWAATLQAVRRALRPGGRLVFESRDPARKAWQEWTRDQTYRRVVISGTGPVQTWTGLTDVQQDLVSFQTTFVFEHDGTVLTSHSTLRFRTRADLAGSLTAAGLVVEEVRDAPGRPGRELVFVVRRPA